MLAMKIPLFQHLSFRPVRDKSFFCRPSREPVFLRLSLVQNLDFRSTEIVLVCNTVIGGFRSCSCSFHPMSQATETLLFQLRFGSEKEWSAGTMHQTLAPSIIKGSDQWEGRGFGRSPNHYMLMGKVVLDVFLSFYVMGCRIAWRAIYCSASKAKKNSICSK